MMDSLALLLGHVLAPVKAAQYVGLLHVRVPQDAPDGTKAPPW